VPIGAALLFLSAIFPGSAEVWPIANKAKNTKLQRKNTEIKGIVNFTKVKFVTGQVIKIDPLNHFYAPVSV